MWRLGEGITDHPSLLMEWVHVTDYEEALDAEYCHWNPREAESGSRLTVTWGAVLRVTS